jgi:transposase
VAAGTRKRVPYENPRGRRVNALGILIADGPHPQLLSEREPRSLTSQDLLQAIQQVPKRTDRLVVVMDNGSIHVSRVIKEALPELRQQGIEFYYLSTCSPELNAIERVFGGMEAHDLPERSYATVPALLDAVDAAFTAAETRLLTRCESEHVLRPPA